MATSWGPVEKPTGHFNEHAPGADAGEVSHPHVGSGGHSENYNASDGRHNKADHQGWPSVDPRSGIVTDTQWDHSVGHFPDGPGLWRQT